MYCRECGHEVSEKAEICMNCGVRPLNGDAYCQGCGTETNPKQELCVKCGVKLVAPKGMHVVSQSDEKAPGLAKAAACCFPIVGIILYFVWKNEKPVASKSMCNWALIGFGVGILFYVLFFILGIIGALSDPYYGY